MNSTTDICKPNYSQLQKFVLYAAILSVFGSVLSEGTHFHDEHHEHDPDCTQCLFASELGDPHQDACVGEAVFSSLPYLMPERIPVPLHVPGTVHARAPPNFS